MLTFDHLVVGAETLTEGVDYIKARLGVEIPFGGSHPLLGTHNHVMQLGDQAFLEVIAIDPNNPVDRARPFALDQFKGPPRPIHWVARLDKMEEVTKLPVDVGPVLDVTRGDLFWQLTVRQDGSMPFEGAHPSVIDWPDAVFPVPRMADLGCSLVSLDISHPQGAALEASLSPFFDDPRVQIKTHDLDLSAEIMTPDGLRSL